MKTNLKTNGYGNDSSGTAFDDFKDHVGKHGVMSKFEYDLYHEEDDKAHTVFRVKRFCTTNRSEKWRVYEDETILFIIDGAKLTNKEKQFLRGVDGVNFVIKQCKSGVRSLNILKSEIKKVLTDD